jgi:uncharacterized damage-inducible protein DinB
MFRRIDDFLSGWAQETEATAKVLDALTDGSLGQVVHPEGRSLGRIAWHIVQTLPEMGNQTGLAIRGPAEEDPIPLSAEVIASRYRETAESLAREIREKWSDDDLQVEDDLYGQRWSRGRTLWALLSHQTHHRGQMTVLMRQAGLQVPGVYGPSREEWSELGMPPQE